MNIDEAFKILKLDNRASKTEVELAYDTLSKSGVNTNMYRSAFEFLMNELYLDKAQEVNEEEIYDEVIESMPEEIINSIQNLDVEDIPKKVIAIWATQKVNIPMLFDSIDNMKDIFGYVRKKDLVEIIHSSACLNDIEYTELTFELSYSSSQLSFRINDLRKFVCGLENIFEKDLIKKFTMFNTEFGVMCRCIVEKNISTCIINMLKIKAKHCNCDLNLNQYG